MSSIEGVCNLVEGKEWCGKGGKNKKNKRRNEQRSSPPAPLSDVPAGNTEDAPANNASRASSPLTDPHSDREPGSPAYSAVSPPSPTFSSALRFSPSPSLAPVPPSTVPVAALNNLFPFPPLKGVPEEQQQLSIRALVIGVCLGAVVSASNIYLGLKTGWTFGASLFGGILGFAILKPLSRIAPKFLGGGYFGPRVGAFFESAISRCKC